MQDTFYEPGEPEVVAERYRRSYATLYDRLRNAKISRLLDGFDFRGKHVLEIGCGGGYWTARFLSAGAKLTVVERSRYLIEATKYELCKRGLNAAVTFVEDDVVDVVFEEEFDFIFAKDVIEHVEDDLQFMDVLSRAARCDAYLLLTTQNSWSANWLIECGYQRIFKRNMRWMGWDPTHLRFYNYMKLHALCKNNGFAADVWFGAYHIPYRLLSCRLEHSVWHVIERFAGSLPLFNITGWAIGVLARRA